MKWTAAQISCLREHYPTMRTRDLARHLGCTPQQVFNKANTIGLHKSMETVARLQREAMANPNHPGRQTQFRKGQMPWNIGLHYQAGGRSVETQFKPGQRGATNVPIGTERIAKGGYLQRKTNDDMPYYKRWKFVHRIVWEATHGLVPDGHTVVFKDGNRLNVALENLELVPRAVLMRRNTIHNYGPQVARLHQLQGAITRQINKRRGKAQ